MLVASGDSAVAYRWRRRRYVCLGAVLAAHGGQHAGAGAAAL